jgi:hypothetical protein
MLVAQASLTRSPFSPSSTGMDVPSACRSNGASGDGPSSVVVSRLSRRERSFNNGGPLVWLC